MNKIFYAMALFTGRIHADVPCSEGDAPPAGIAVTPVMPTVHFVEGKANLT